MQQRNIDAMLVYGVQLLQLLLFCYFGLALSSGSTFTLYGIAAA
jgi:hypothetical protein